jgi:hypothetical protein
VALAEEARQLVRGQSGSYAKEEARDVETWLAQHHR